MSKEKSVEIKRRVFKMLRDGKNPRQVARKVGISYQTIYNWRCGVTSRVCIDTIVISRMIKQIQSCNQHEKLWRSRRLKTRWQLRKKMTKMGLLPMRGLEKIMKEEL